MNLYLSNKHLSTSKRFHCFGIFITLFLILFFVIPDLITDIFDIKPFFLSWEIDKHPWFFFVDLTQLITFNFIRLSELHELLFNFYIISHIYYLKNFFNLKTWFEFNSKTFLENFFKKLITLLSFVF